MGSYEQRTSSCGSKWNSWACVCMNWKGVWPRTAITVANHLQLMGMPKRRGVCAHRAAKNQEGKKAMPGAPGSLWKCLMRSSLCAQRSVLVVRQAYKNFQPKATNDVKGLICQR